MSFPKCVLLIDDDFDDVQFFRTAIENISRQIIVWSNHDCDIAVDDLANGSFPKPDMIFMDWHMPRLSGEQCLSTIKNINGWANVPVIVLTGLVTDDRTSQMKALGAADVMVKEWNLKSMVQRLEEVFLTNEGSLT